MQFIFLDFQNPLPTNEPTLARVSPEFRQYALELVCSIGEIGLATSLCWNVLECGQGNGGHWADIHLANTIKMNMISEETPLNSCLGDFYRIAKSFSVQLSTVYVQ
jgi:hypothetical protein